ncbi:MAG: hypothetical protein Q8P59_14650 [Dehalococcoidia bacterium]|nr:hypothetical protein [Dehalococcoidia bacterium]
MAKDKLGEILDQALSFDPLQTVEDLTGEPYQNNPALGFFIMQEHAEAKRALLAVSADVYNSMDHRLYVGTMKDLGFEVILEEGFQNRDGTQEKFYIFAHRELGLIAKADTWGGTINSAEVYLNWKPDNQEDPHFPRDCHMSGGFGGDPGVGRKSWVYVGHFDARQGVRHMLKKLQEAGGTLLPKWEYRHGGIYLNHYMEGKDERGLSLPCPKWGEKVREVTRARMEKFPQWVKDIFEGATQDY